MNTDLQIQVSTPGQLTVHSPIALFPVPAILTLALLSVIFYLIYRSTRANAPRGQNRLLLGFWLFGFVLLLFFGMWSHTVTLTRDANDIHVVDKFAGVTYSDRHYPLNELRQGIIETARSGPRIGLLMQNGVVVHPLGKAYNPKPSLDLALIKINDFVSAGPDGQPASHAPTYHDELKREIEANEKANRDALARGAQKK